MKLKGNDIYENNKNNEYTFNYNSNYENDAGIWENYEKIIKNKYNKKEIELLSQDLWDEDLEEEKEYLLKVKEIYQEYFFN